MKSWKMNIAVVILGVMLAVTVVGTAPAQDYPAPAGISACAVPIPDSLPGEEKKDAITAITGLGVLLVFVGGSLLYLQKKKEVGAK